jgi:hypothetical protein
VQCTHSSHTEPLCVRVVSFQRKDAYELHVLLAQLEAASRSVGEAMAVTEKLILAGLNNVTQPPPVTAKMNTAQVLFAM